MPEPKCIYCADEVPTGGFNTEHVISRAFGTFANNLTLTNTVCRTCNQIFGDHMERVLGRDSLEAFERIKRGLKPAEEIVRMPQERLTFTAALGGEWEGLRLSLIAESGSDAVTLLPQVGLPKRTGAGWTYLSDRELADLSKPLPDDFDRQARIRIIGPTDEVMQRLIDLLAERGIAYDQEGSFPLPQPEADEIEIYVNMKIDPVVRRCVAKYAFNYMAYVTSGEFASLSAFDVIRKYIRYGNTPGYPLVAADGVPILATDSRGWRQTDGHLVTVNWTRDKRHIVGQVSLFNHVRYRVGLSRNFSGLWRPIRSGHHFDLVSRQISPLSATSLVVP